MGVSEGSKAPVRTPSGGPFRLLSAKVGAEAGPDTKMGEAGGLPLVATAARPVLAESALRGLESDYLAVLARIVPL